MSDKEGSESDKIEKFTILTQSEEEYQRQMKVLNSINMDSMVEMILNEDLLKSNFKCITDVLKKQFGILNMCQQNLNNMGKGENEEEKIQRMLKEQQDLKDLIMKLMKENAENRKQIDKLKEQEQSGDLEGMSQQSEEIGRKVNDMDNLLKRVSEQMAGGQDNHKNHDDELKQLEEAIHKLIQESNNNNNNNQDNSSENQLQDLLEKLKSSVGRVQVDIGDKVNCDIFEETMEGLKSLGGHTGGETGGKVQRVDKAKSRDGNKVQMLEDRVKALEEQMKGQGDKLAGLLDNVKQEQQLGEEGYEEFLARHNTGEDRLQELEDNKQKLGERLTKAEDNKAERSELKKLNADRDRIKKELQEMLSKIKEIISSANQNAEHHTNEIEELKRKQDQNNKKLGDMQRKQNQQGNQQDMTKIQQSIDQAVGGLKEELGELINKLQQDIDKKDLDEQMQTYQQKIFQKIDEIVGALMKKLANKDDTKKALAYLEKKITELYLMVTPEEKNKNDLDGLLVKRPLFWSCVTCDKDGDQYSGQKNWKGVQQKDTSPERNPPFPRANSNRKSNDHEKQKDQSITNTTGFPEIHNNQQEKSKYIVRK